MKTNHAFLRSAVFFLLLSFSFKVLLAQSSSSAKTYSRIVSLAPSVTEMIYALGAEDRLVGVTTYCDYPEAAKLKPKVGGYTEHNLEAIVSVQPDLVILTPNRGTKFTYEQLKQIGIETLVVPLDSLEDLKQSFRLMGEKIGKSKEGRDLELKLIDTIEQYKSAVKNPRKAAFINWHSPLVIAGGGTLENDIMTLTGGDNIAKDSRDHYPHWNIEALFKYNPDLIIDASRHGANINIENHKEIVKKFWGLYPVLKAVRNSEIYVFKQNVYSVPGPRTVILIQALGAIFSGDSKAIEQFYERVKI